MPFAEGFFRTVVRGRRLDRLGRRLCRQVHGLSRPVPPRGRQPTRVGAAKTVIHSIVTTETDRRRIVAHPAFKRLSECAEVVFTCFPEKFLEQRERNHYNFYYFYGLLDHQSVSGIGIVRRAVSSSRGYRAFARQPGKPQPTPRRRARPCSVAGVECDPNQLRAWLDGRGRGMAGELDLPADELLSAAIARPDGYFRSLFMTPDNQAFCGIPAN